MEKIVYAVWGASDTDRARFADDLRTNLLPRLAPLTRNVRLNVRDMRVGGGSSPCFSALDREIDAVVQLWLDTALPMTRTPVDAVIGSMCERFSAWLVCESVPLAAAAPQDAFSQIVFLQRPEGLDLWEWRERWQERHTNVAIETQATTGYVQNLVVRPLTRGAVPYAAIVEETFPIAALHDEAAFYDALGNPTLLKDRRTQMMESCATFMDFAHFECFPTSAIDA